MEHLPRVTATYNVDPVNWGQAKLWLEQSGVISAVRTTEMITAIKAGLDVALAPSPAMVAIHPGDEALLITLSFGVLLAWAEQSIAPLPEDWRCMLLRVQARSELQPSNVLAAAIGEEVVGEPVGESLRSSRRASRHDALDLIDNLVKPVYFGRTATAKIIYPSGQGRSNVATEVRIGGIDSERGTRRTPSCHRHSRDRRSC